MSIAPGMSQAGQAVAIKEYLDPGVETQKRFRAEARQLSGLSHPQLPQVLDHFAIENSGQYLVSAYVDGVDLQELLDQYGPLPSHLIIGYMQAALRTSGLFTPARPFAPGYQTRQRPRHP